MRPRPGAEEGNCIHGHSPGHAHGHGHGKSAEPTDTDTQKQQGGADRMLRKEPTHILPAGDAKLTKCDESTICPGLFLCGPQVRQDNEIFCFVYKYRQRFGVVINDISKRLGMPDVEREKAVEKCRKHHMFLDDISCCKATCGAGSC